MFYMYCVKMGRSQDEFWNSSFVQVVKMIDMYADELQMKTAAYKNESYESKYFKEEVKSVKSLKEIRGLV